MFDEDDFEGQYLKDIERRADKRIGYELEKQYPPEASPEKVTSTSVPTGSVDFTPTLNMTVGMPGAQPPKEEEQWYDGALETAQGVASDVLRGVTEVPRSLATGTINAGNEFMDTIYDVGNKMREMGIGPNGYFQVGSEGITWKEGSIPKGEVPALPNFDDPQSTTGKFVQQATQFLAGMAGAGKIAPFLTKGVSTGAKIAGGTGAGAISDFAFMDDAQNRLSGLFEGTALENDFTTWLASPEDEALNNRFKNALEGAGLGLGAEALLQTARGLRAYSRREPQASPQLTREQQVESSYNLARTMDEMLGGSESDPIVSFKQKTDSTQGAMPDAEARIGSAEADLDANSNAIDDGVQDEMYINFSRIESEDDIKEVIGYLANRQKETIRGEQRGTQSFSDINQNAGQVDAWETLMSRRTGEALNAEESVAARTLWASSANKLVNLAKEAADNPSEANIFAFRRMASVHNAIQQQVLGSRTETARSLASWRISVSPDEEMARTLSQVLSERGGSDLGREMASRVAALADAGQYREMDEFLKRANQASNWDMFQEYWINSLLSGVKTHVVNMSSGMVVLGLRMAERRVAGHIENMLGGDGSTLLNESAAMMSGIIGGMKDALVYAGQTFNTNTSRYGANKLELEHPHSITSESMNLSKDSWLGKTVDILGSVIRLPTRTLSAEDEFFKTLAYRMELHSLAHRQVISEVQSGKITQEQIASRTQEILDNPPTTIGVQSADFAQYATFTNTPGKLGQAVQKLANIGPLKFLLPFVRTPANIFSYTMERTPFAPLMSRSKQEWAAGGSRRRIMEAQIAIGTGVMLTGIDLAMNGAITGEGPKEPAAREHFYRTGKKPYSIQIGDKWYQYNRFDPFGTQLSIAASIAEITQNVAEDDNLLQDTEKAAIATVLAIGNSALNKTYLSGLANAMKALSDPGRYGESWAGRFAGSLIPAAVGNIARIQDPYLREVSGSLDSIKSRIPGLSESLPPRRDLWGRAITTASGMGWAYDFLSPVAVSQYKPQPVDVEMERLGVYIPSTQKEVTFTTRSASVTMNLTQFEGLQSRYAELAGNALKHPVYKKGCMDFLNDTINGRGMMSSVYAQMSDGEDGQKAVFIRNTVNDYRKLARAQLMHESEALRTRVNYEIDLERKKRGAL